MAPDFPWPSSWSTEPTLWLCWPETSQNDSKLIRKKSAPGGKSQLSLLKTIMYASQSINQLEEDSSTPWIRIVKKLTPFGLRLVRLLISNMSGLSVWEGSSIKLLQLIRMVAVRRRAVKCRRRRLVQHHVRIMRQILLRIPVHDRRSDHPWNETTKVAFFNRNYFFPTLVRLINRLIDWLIDSLIDWLTHWLIDWLTHWLIDWLTNFISSSRILFTCFPWRFSTTVTTWISDVGGRSAGGRTSTAGSGLAVSWPALRWMLLHNQGSIAILHLLVLLLLLRLWMLLLMLLLWMQIRLMHHVVTSNDSRSVSEMEKQMKKSKQINQSINRRSNPFNSNTYPMFN